MNSVRMTEHALPTGGTAYDALARMLARLCGPAFQAPDDSANAADFVTLGRSLHDVRETLSDCLDNAFTTTADALLTEWEATLRVPTDEDISGADRRDVLTAKWQSRRSGSPSSILAALRILDSGANLREYSAAECASTLPRCVFRFGVQIPTYYGAPKEPLVRSLLDAMKPAHTDYSLTSKPLSGFLCDDADSVCDDTLLGE